MADVGAWRRAQSTPIRVAKNAQTHTHTHTNAVAMPKLVPFVAAGERARET